MNFNSSEFFVSVQAMTVSILLTSFKSWPNQAGFLVHLEAGRSYIKRCPAVQGIGDEKSCHTGATLVGHFRYFKDIDTKIHILAGCKLFGRWKEMGSFKF